ncbi:MAG: NYN domain-containing protein [Raoultibacter sp.]
MDKRFALLIDADNVSAKYIKPILEELSKYGTVTYKRIYGDWTNTQNGKWKDELLTSSITPIQQFGYTQGKNATDSAMIIDAMDILYTSSVEGFCLVSSDSDFTKLASRIRESGLTVIGMGEKKTPQPFRKACDIFTVLELLVEESALGKEEVRRESKEDISEGTQTIPKEKIESAVVKIILDNQNNNKETGLGEVGSRLVKRYPDFDVRSYGYSLLSRLLEEFPRVKTIKEGNTLYVALNDAQVAEEDPAIFIRRVVVAAGRSGIDLAALGKKVKNEYKGFKVRDSGYSQFKQYVKSLDDIAVSEGENGLKAIALD